MSISKEAIEAGVRAYWLEGQAAGVIFTHTTYDDMHNVIREGLVRAFTKGVEVALQEMSASQDCKVSPQTVQSPPATATQVAIDDEEVERVARVMATVYAGRDEWDDTGEGMKNMYRIMARAAIRAIREGGQRWGVWCQDPDTNSPGGWSEIAMGVVSTSDKALADSVAANKNRGLGCVCYEVRPYDAEGEAERKEAERIARIGHDAFQKALGRAVPVQFDSMTKKWQDAVVAQAEAISAAIRATKGGK